MSDPYGWDAFWRMYGTGVWEPSTHALIEATLTPGDLFLDVGAWIGPTALWARYQGAEVIAVEPDPVAAAELRRFMPDVDVREGALVAECAECAYLAANPVEGGFLGDSMSRLAPEGLEVVAWTIDELLGDRRPALVKIDVEGYEIDLCPSLMPDLAARGATVQVSFHGRLPEPEWFAGFTRIEWPAEPTGDLVARP